MGSIPQLSILRGPTRAFKPNYCHRIFEEKVAQHPDAIALMSEGPGAETTRQTYQNVNEITNQQARYILKLIRDGSLPRNEDGDYIVAVSMKPSIELVQVLLSIWKCGCAYLPLDPTFPATRIEHILRESKPVLVICTADQPHEELFDQLSTKLTISELRKQSPNFCPANLGGDEHLKHLKDDLAIVLYTSGSTGIPKGVRLPHKVILNRLHWQFKSFPYSQSERVGVFKTALTFVDSVSEIWGPLLTGLSVLVVPKCVTTDPEKLVAVLDKYKIERLVLVPSLLRSLLLFLKMKDNKTFLTSLRIWVCSGETLSVTLAEEFFDYFNHHSPILCNFYGSTEIMGDVTFHVMENAEQLRHQSKVPIGAPVDNTTLYLLDKDLRPVKAGDRGELFVAGLNIAAGYVNNRDPDKFIDNPLGIEPMFSTLFRTGDFAIIEKGSLVFEGRIDSQVKIRGHRVDLSEVEKAVTALPDVEKAVVLCYKPGEVSQALLAFVVTRLLLSEQQIESRLRKTLSGYMVPQVILIEHVPLLVNGKIDRQSLLKSYETTNNNEEDSTFQVDIDYNGVPGDQLQMAKILFETVAQVLQRSVRSVINVHANFYDIGGNSLNSIYTISTLKERGYQISIGDFIAAKQLGDILKIMQPVGVRGEIMLQSTPKGYRRETLSDAHKARTIDIISGSFLAKADLEQWIPEIKTSDYDDLIGAVWPTLIKDGLSFIVLSEETGQYVGVTLNFDLHREPDVQITSKLAIIFEFLEFVEGPVRDHQLPKNVGDVLHVSMMGTHICLPTKENIVLMQFMEDEVLQLARDKHFKGIMTTNTSPLTQQLGESVFGYKTMLDYQVNEYVAPDGTKPFGLAPALQRAIVHYKGL